MTTDPASGSAESGPPGAAGSAAGLAASPDRVADAVAELAAGVADPHLRTQLHALVGVVRNLGRPVPADDPATLATLDAALAAGDEPASLRAARDLTRARRAAGAPTDWSQASG